ncbi:hypothetical protein Syun_002779 [Stephania yunnanensis]|uniref:Uncharacterized protein n=1 Tax=Stephania yunnanensis TaxID=152371 RepID=A0AAP0LKB4_9MAGN
MHSSISIEDACNHYKESHLIYGLACMIGKYGAAKDDLPTTTVLLWVQNL